MEKLMGEYLRRTTPKEEKLNKGDVPPKEISDNKMALPANVKLQGTENEKFRKEAPAESQNKITGSMEVSNSQRSRHPVKDESQKASTPGYARLKYAGLLQNKQIVPKAPPQRLVGGPGLRRLPVGI